MKDQLDLYQPVLADAIRASAQLAAVAGLLAAAMIRLWSSVPVLGVMFVVASVTAAHRSQASGGSAWLAVPLGLGLAAVLPLLLLSAAGPLTHTLSWVAKQQRFGQ